MIITLKGADFSGSNIGTLTTWTIFTTIGSGATYDGVKTVDRGASYSGTVTLADGYEVGTVGVTVTMGGTALTDAVTIDGSTITISISAVTGTVYISVPTKNTATGEEDDGSTVNLFDGTILDYSNGNDWYVMYSKAAYETDTENLICGLVTSNSLKAKNVVIENLEAGATYRIYFKNNTSNTSRCRIVTFAEAFDDITIAALSTDTNTGTTTTSVIEYDLNNNTYEYDNTFTNTQNHKTLVMTIGWASAANGTVDLDVEVYKVS